MAHTLNVHALPRLVTPEELTGGIVVVIDVLRASTTIVQALESGATEIIPCEEVAEARAVAEQIPNAILGGERKGMPIEGFKLGNSPGDYLPHRVNGRSIVFTTSHGTRAIAHAHSADRVLIGAFVNVSAIFKELINQRNIHLLCAGTDGQISQEDVLLAGMLVERLQRQGGMLYEQNAQAVTARENWLHSFALPRALGAEPLEPELLAKQLRKSLGGKNLVALGMEKDILLASKIDQFECIPELNPERTRIRAV